MAKIRILVVEDEKNIAETVKYNLEKEGFSVTVTDSGSKAFQSARKEPPDLVLLDWMLPDMDGLETCRMLRQDERTRSVPVIMVTVKSSETDKVLGLEMGADDYVTKPFNPRELVARIRAVLRRSRLAETTERAVIGDLEIDRGKHLVRLKGKPVELTAKEYELLRFLVEARGRVVTRESILENVWDYRRSSEIETRTVDLHISQLRRKIGREAARLMTVKGTGYRFRLDD